MSTFSYEDAPEEKVQIYDLGYPLGGRLEVRRARPVQSGGSGQRLMPRAHTRTKT
jgi:hypothetical protein